MSCQRRGIGLACIILCAEMLPISVVEAAAPPAEVAAVPASATATAAPIRATPASAGSSGAQASAAPGSQPALPPLPLNPDQVLAYINRTLGWYRQSQSLAQEPQLSTDVVERNRLRETALTALRLAFQFGRASATQLAASRVEAAQAAGSGAGTARNAAAGPSVSSTGSASAGAPPRNPSVGQASSAGASGGAQPAGSATPAAAQSQRSLDQANARIASRMMQLQSQLAALDARLARASARSRGAVRAERDQVAAALALQREVQTTVNELQRFQSSMLALQGSGAKDLLGRIADLERTVPEERQGGSAEGAGGGASGGPNSTGQSSSSSGAAAGGPAAAQGAGPSGTLASGGAPASGAASATTFNPESAGIITLIGQWFALQGADSRLDGALKSTDALIEGLDAVRAPLVAQARSLAREDTSGVDSTDPAELEASRRTLEAAAARFRQLAAVLVPLGDQDFMLESARGTLTEWRGALGARVGAVARGLLERVVILAALIGAVLVVSEIWRRAVFKYLHDARRRNQFQSLRRVIIGVLLALVILFALASEIGSLATYVGFLTAGLAVALQTVILSIVAYFFFIGRYGVRVGDRITLSGVTGRVVDIGLIRIYLMELAGPELRSTGRIVVLSNSVLFQPQALFKQIPGADYLWHTIALTLAPTVDVQAAQQQLKRAANEVFGDYRSSIEAQHAAVQRLVEFDAAAPSPEVRVRFAEHGWQFEVRYPVQAEQAARIDQRMLKAVRAAVADAEHFPLAESGAPALKVEA